MRRKRLSGWTPTKMFSATLRSGKSVGSWKMIAIPAACDCLALSKIASSPSIRSRPASGSVHAGEDLDERGLAGAVLADEAVHLAPEQLDVAVVERMDGAEALLRVLQGDDGCERCFRHDRGEEGAPRVAAPPFCRPRT